MRSLLLAAALLLPLSAHSFECPASSAEKAEDCPWAGAARLLGDNADRGEALDPVFSAHVPGLLRQLDADRGVPALLKLWGESINYDELAEGQIVEPGVLAFLLSRAGAPQARGRVAHAGVEHTYGYLFSLLPTKFGFKRARWVRSDIEDGLGLPRGLAGPAPSEGTLLSNVTCLAGAVALGDNPAASSLLSSVRPHCAAALRSYVPPSRARLTETVRLPGGRTISLRTDFVPFSAERGGNAYLLVYSVLDSAAGQARLVTAFPVNSGFVKSALSPVGLGSGKPVQTRYNAYVEGFTGAGKFKGERSVTRR